MQLNPYLTFDGRCAEAFGFYETVLGGKIIMMMPHKGTPAEAHVPPDWLDKIMHASLDVGGVRLMGSDSPPDRYQRPAGITVSLQPTDIEDAERLFAALSEGGTVTMAIQQTFWARRFGMVTDRFAIPWMVNCE